MKHEVKFTALDLKLVDEAGTFEGYASLFNREDMGHDVILPGAFRDSLANRGVAGIKMLFQHDPAQPIGVWNSLLEDPRGLFVRGQLTRSVAKAQEVLALLRSGALDGLSIGFKVVSGRRDARTGVRRLSAVDLWEISIVTFPMQPGARVTSVKARPFLGGVPTEREFERWLTRDAGLTRTEARAVLRSGLEGLAGLRDAGSGATPEKRLAGRIRRAANLLQLSNR